jgi:hypothetical protein
LTRNGDSSNGRFYTWRGPLHDVNPMRRWRGRRYASLYRRIAQGGAKQLCNSDEARRKRGNDTRDAVQQVTHENKKRVGWGCVNQDEHRRLRRLMGDGLWTRLGKKNARYKQFPGNKGRMMPLLLRRHSSWRLQVTERKRKKKHGQEMRSRESPENFFENEACVLFQGSKTSVQFCK